MPKPLRYGFPHWVIADAPTLQIADGGVYRASIALALAYWRAGCQPLPQDEVTVAALCRLPVGTWRLHKTRVMQALSEMSPFLDQEWKHHAKISVIRSRIVQRANAVRIAKRLARQKPQAALPQRLDTPHTTHMPDNVPSPHIIHARQGNSAASPAENPPKPPKKPAPGFTD